MKLYVWNSPYPVSYGASILYSIAESEEQAREIAQGSLVSKYGYTPEKNHEILSLGAPDRVHDLPYAEIYEWSE